MRVPDLLKRAGRLFGPRVAVAADPPGSGRDLTYTRLEARVVRLATALQRLGLEPGARVASLAWNSPRLMECFLAAPLAGMVMTPLNTRLAPPELAFILEDSGAAVLLAAREFLPVIESLRAQLRHLKHLVLLDAPAQGAWLGLEQLLLESIDPAGLIERDWQDEDLLLLCYTGGTTGLPKGVMLSQRNVLASSFTAIQMQELSGRDVWLHAAPMFHLADAWACYALTALGARHVFLPRFEPGAALSLIGRQRVTATSIVPTMINALLESPQAAQAELSSLRRVLYGASSMPVERLKAAVARFGPILQQAYGQTEAAPFLASTALESTVLPERPGAPLSETQVRRLASCGQPVLGMEVRVVDAQGRDAAEGQVGEVIARGPNIMLGYWNRPEETANALRDGWLHTGDLAWRDADQFLFIVDRAKDVVVSGGENIFSSEVENALYRHPAVLEAAIVGAPDAYWGEVVKAVVVLRNGHLGDAAMSEALIEHCRALIARYKCPRLVEFRASLPKSGAGKILKSELRKAEG